MTSALRPERKSAYASDPSAQRAGGFGRRADPTPQTCRKGLDHAQQGTVSRHCRSNDTVAWLIRSRPRQEELIRPLTDLQRPVSRECDLGTELTAQVRLKSRLNVAFRGTRTSSYIRVHKKSVLGLGVGVEWIG